MTVEAGIFCTLSIAGEVADRTYAFRPYGRTIVIAFLAVVSWWLAYSWWQLVPERGSAQDALTSYSRIQAVGVTIVAVILSIGAIGWLFRELSE